MEKFKGTTRWKLGNLIAKEGEFKTLTDDLGRMVIAFRHGNQIGDDKCIANEHLLESAPELLEALQNTLSALKSFISSTPPGEWIEVQQAEAAINKALGIK